MFGILSNWNMRISERDKLLRENSALRARAEAAENTHYRCREDKGFYYSTVTELLAALQEALVLSGVEQSKLNQYRSEGRWDASWYESLPLFQQKLVSCYVTSTELQQDIFTDTHWAGLMEDYPSHCTPCKEMLLG